MSGEGSGWDADVVFAKPALWDAGIWPRVKHLVLVTRLTARCAIKGHEWKRQRPTRCADIAACRICGSYIGARVTAAADAPCRWYRRPAEDGASS